MNTKEHYKIVAITQIKNELRKGNLERFFKYVQSNVDAIVLYDDVSTDGSYEYAKQFTSHTLRGTVNMFASEWQIKQRLVEKALTLNPDFILLIDADEVIADADGKKLQELANWVIEKDLDGANIHDINLWRSSTWKRTDSDFDSARFPRFWRVNNRALTYTNRKEGLHQSPTPDQIVKIKSQDILSFLHYGFADEKNIASKYITYASHGQRGDNLARIIQEEGILKTERVPKHFFPDGLWVDEHQPKELTRLQWSNILQKHRKEVTRPGISIVCLIFKSTAWLEFVYSQVVKYTDLSDKEFFFIANDATDEVKEYLKNNYIPHYIFDNTEEHKSEWYINNVYRAYNYGAEKAQGDFVLFINSDMAFTPNWVENAFSQYNGTNCVCSQLVQNDKFPTDGAGFVGVEKNFGYHISDFEETKFQEFAQTISEDKNIPGGSFMPLLIKKEHFNKVGGYPEGNITVGSDPFKPVIAKKGEPLVSGDVAFMEKLQSIGISHTTALNSLAYHFQEGEKQDVAIDPITQKPLILIANSSLLGRMKEKVLWNFMLERLPRSAGIDMATVGANELNFPEKTQEYVNLHFKEAQICIQNASFLDVLLPQLHTVAFLQDDLRQMNRTSPQQEDTLLLSTSHVSNSIFTAASYPEYDFTIINIGVDTELFTPGDKKSARTKHSIPLEKKVGIFVGDLSEVKGWTEIHKLVRNHPEIHWIIVSKETEHLEETNVTNFRQVPQQTLRELHQCADFFIIGSKVETLCLAAMEACCCDVPVIMRPIGVFADFSDKEKNDCGIFGDDFESAINQIDKKKFNPRKVMIERGLTIENTINNWWNLIARLRLINKLSTTANSHQYTKSAHIKRKLKRVLSKNFIILITRRNLPRGAYSALLNSWRFGKKTLRLIRR